MLAILFCIVQICFVCKAIYWVSLLLYLGQ